MFGKKKELTGDAKVLNKFKKAAVIETEAEMEVLREWSLVGAVRFGVDMIGQEAEAILTKKGKHLLSMM